MKSTFELLLAMTPCHLLREAVAPVASIEQPLFAIIPLAPQPLAMPLSKLMFEERVAIQPYVVCEFEQSEYLKSISLEA